MKNLDLGALVWARPRGRSERAFCRVERVEETGGGDIAHGIWHFEDGSGSLETGIYAAMCQQATRKEYAAAKTACESMNIG